MKAIVLFLFLALLSVSVVSAEDVQVNVSQSTVEITGDSTLRIHNVNATALGLDINGRYWGEFQWDPANYVFVPLSFGEELVTPPSQSLLGTYTLKGYYIKYSDGSTTSDKTTPASGTMTIGTNTMTQAFTINGDSFTASTTYSVVHPKGSADGFILAADQTGTYDLVFWTSGDDFNTYSGIISMGNGWTYQEWDYWTKINDAVTANSLAAVPSDSTGTLGGSIGLLNGYLSEE